MCAHHVLSSLFLVFLIIDLWDFNYTLLIEKTMYCTHSFSYNIKDEIDFLFTNIFYSL